MDEAGELIRAIEHAQKTERERIASMVEALGCIGTVLAAKGQTRSCDDFHLDDCPIAIAAMIREQGK